MDDKLKYMPNDGRQNYYFYSLQLFGHCLPIKT